MSDYDRSHGIIRLPCGAPASAGGRFATRGHPDAVGVTLDAAAANWARSQDRPDVGTYRWPVDVPRERAIVAYDDERHLYTFGSGTVVDTWLLPSYWIDTHVGDVGIVASAGVGDRLDVHVADPWSACSDMFELTSTSSGVATTTVSVSVDEEGGHWACVNGHGAPVDLRADDASERMRADALADRVQRATARAIEKELVGERGAFARHCRVFPTYRDERASLTILAGSKEQFRGTVTFDEDGVAHLGGDSESVWGELAKWARVPKADLRERLGRCRRLAMSEVE